MKILVLIDCQNDFIDGSLRNEEAIKTVPNIVNKIKENHYDIVFATFDTHYNYYLDTKEGKALPIKHCIYDTPGYCMNKDIFDALAENGISYRKVDKNTFGSKKLPVDIDNVRHNNTADIELIGFCTDICVISNALYLKASQPELYNITVDASCCAGTTPERHKAALEVMKSCQIKVVNENQQMIEMVDLGLPSGTLWADCNLGAEKPEEFGNYYAWGETIGYPGNINCKKFDLDTYEFYNGDANVFSKYNDKDSLIQLESCDDAVLAEYGPGYCMPNDDDFNELIKHTTHEVTTVNGVKGN